LILKDKTFHWAGSHAKKIGVIWGWSSLLQW